jgi:putative sigma-54 modulation protein
MNVIVNGRNFEISTSVREYAQEKIHKFDKFLNDATEAVFTLSVEKYRHKAEVMIKAGKVQIQAESITAEMYSSIDEVLEKLDRQVRKHKEKTTDRRKEGKKAASKSGPPLKAEAPGPEDVGLEGIVVIKKEKFAMKPMSPEEAAMQLNLLDKDFYVFRNDSNSRISVIYKRKDGDFGLIEPAQ